MNKFVILALLGVVSAKKHHQHKDILSLIFGDDEPAKKCLKIAEEEIGCAVQTRMFMGALWRGWVKGFYQENADVIPDTCMGQWMEEPLMTVWGTGMKIRQDTFSVDVKEAETAVLAGVDTYYKNRDECKIVKVRDDGWNWCLANTEKCLFFANTEDRIYDNVVPLAGKAIDFFKLMMIDDSCYTVQEQVNEVYRIFEDIGETMSILMGFDLTWAQSDNAQRVHLAKHPFVDQVHAIKKAAHLTKREKWEKAFPESAVLAEEMIDEVKSEVKDFEHDMAGIFTPMNFHIPSLFPTHHNKPQHHAPKHHSGANFFDPLGIFPKFPKMPKVNHFF